MRHRILVGLLLVLLASPAGADPLLQQTRIRAGGWNTDLQPWLPYEAQVIKTIKKMHLDVLALSEVWTESAKDRIVSHPVVAKRYTHHFYAPSYQEIGICPIFVPDQFMTDYIDCLVDNGIDTTTVEQSLTPIPSGCTILGLNLQLTEAGCYECIVNTMQSLPGDPYASVDACTFATGARYSHGGSPGLLILSKAPIEDVTVVPYDTFAIKRAVVYATIAGVRYAFTQFPSNTLADVDPALAPFMTGALQPQLAQDIIAAAPDVVIGDFNSGPDYQPTAHELLASAYTPLLSRPTYCSERSHASFAPCQVAAAQFGVPGGPLSIDNIYVRNPGVCPRRTFARRAASDHVGVSTVCHLKP